MAVGQDFGDGFIIGINNSQTGVVRAASDLGNAALSGTSSAIAAASAAKETEKLGEFFSEGLAVGMLSKQNLVAAAATQVAKAAVQASHQQLMATNPQPINFARGSSSGTAAAIGGGQHSQAPVVHVYIDGQEFRGMIKTEMADRDKQLRRAIAVQKRR